MGCIRERGDGLKISDAIRQLEELKAMYGDLPIMCREVCEHKLFHLHVVDCFDSASIAARDVRGTFGGSTMRLVVID